MMLLVALLLYSIRLGAARALLAMQAPAITREYQSALLQLVHSSDQEIAQRTLLSNTIIGPRREEDEKRFLAQLRAVDPSNAETLAASLELEHSLQEAYTRIAQAPDLLHPIVAAKDVAAHEEDSRHQIARTVLDSFVPQLDLSFASAVYGHRFVLHERRCHRPVPERELHLSRFSEALRREEAV